MSGTNIIAEAEQIAFEADQKGQLCGICSQPKDGEFPFCSPCFDALKPCTRCGERKGHYNIKTKKQHGMCSSCFSQHLENKQLMAVKTDRTGPDITVEVHQMLERLRRTNLFIDGLRESGETEAAAELEPLLRRAEDLFDEDRLNGCDQKLRQLSFEKIGIDLANRLTLPAYEELDGYILDLFNRAVECWAERDYGRGFEYINELEAVLDYEDQMAEEAEQIEKKSVANVRQVEEAIRARKTLTETRSRNRAIRESFMARRPQTPPAPVTKPASAPTVTETRPCLKCGKMSEKRVCLDCHHKVVPMCPNCNERRVHVANNGQNMPNCFECFRDQKAADDLQTPRPKGSKSDYRTSDWRDRKLATSQAGPKGLIIADTSKQSKGKNKK
jgi:hypothetical protein